jgi:hypothetical protein
MANKLSSFKKLQCTLINLPYDCKNIPKEVIFKEVDPLNAPIVLWLQGGPGGSSLFGQFELNGPYQAVYNWYGKPHAKLNPYAWNKKVNIIYIDNPVSAGKKVFCLKIKP